MMKEKLAIELGEDAARLLGEAVLDALPPANARHLPQVRSRLIEPRPFPYNMGKNAPDADVFEKFPPVTQKHTRP
jgi:hypothetical protein